MKKGEKNQRKPLHYHLPIESRPRPVLSPSRPTPHPSIHNPHPNRLRPASLRMQQHRCKLILQESLIAIDELWSISWGGSFVGFARRVGVWGFMFISTGWKKRKGGDLREGNVVVWSIVERRSYSNWWQFPAWAHCIRGNWTRDEWYRINLPPWFDHTGVYTGIWVLQVRNGRLEVFAKQMI